MTRSPLKTVDALIIVWLALLGSFYSLVATSPDQAIFDYIGWRLLEGDALYTGVAEQNFPGKIWIHAAATALFGRTDWSFRTFDFILCIASTAAFSRLLPLPRARALRCSLIVYPVIYATSDLWSSGCRDIVAAHFMLVASAMLGSQGQRSGWCAFVAGAILAYALLIRPTYVFFPAGLMALAIWMAMRSGPDRAAAIRKTKAGVAGAATILGPCVVIGTVTGQLSEWYDLTVRYNLNCYSGSAQFGSTLSSISTFTRWWSPLVALGLCGLVAWVYNPRHRLRGLAVAGVMISCIASSMAQGKGFGYHISGIIPTLTLGVIYGAISLCWRTTPSTRLIKISRVAMLSILALLLATKFRSQLGAQAMWRLGLTGEDTLAQTPEALAAEQTTELIMQSTSSTDHVLVWDRQVQINYLSGRRSPSRFITIWALEAIGAEFAIGQSWVDELANDLRTKQPPIIVIGAAYDPARFGDAHVAAPRAIQVLQAALEDSYGLERQIGSLSIYRRSE